MSTRTAGAPRPEIPRLVVTDLDGTFLSPDGTVSDENRAAVLAAQRAGILVLFATGRPVRWLDVIRDLPGAHPTVIASNGAVLYDLGADQLIDRVCLPPSAAVAAVRAIRAVAPDAGFAVESGSRFGHDPGYRTLRRGSATAADIFAAPAEELAAREDCVKMLVQDRTRSADELLAAVLAVVGDTLTVTHSVTTGFALVEISGPGVSKASMLERCCRRLGVERADVAAFGDMPNDVDMLTWAGMPHVVANAHPSLLTGSYRVVPGNDRSGVGRTIAAWAAAGASLAPLPLPTP
ncbi:HAD family hydrolase [uncultured Friedmanniella sp.]|uniref:HAD family hydrolase n=1 Tax=uncultured Friedmanniella sp. TaxID=335381 RepID=UPI0035CCA8E6